MAWPAAEVQARVDDFRRDSSRWETDYSRLLIFVTGNLDELYDHLAEAVEDCDTDADVFHAMSRKLSASTSRTPWASAFAPSRSRGWATTTSSTRRCRARRTSA